jgi:hypothetical protein
MRKTVATRNPGAGKKAPRVDAVRYAAMRAALLAVVPRDGEGVLFASLPTLVAKVLPKGSFRGASIPWYVATVKLDLEARGILRRVPGSRLQRLLRGRSRA